VEVEFVFCNNELAQWNVIVDYETLKIKAIVDWEYAEFNPPWFKRPFYTRLGPSVVQNGVHAGRLQVLWFLR
jgi:hypothetical protein